MDPISPETTHNEGEEEEEENLHHGNILNEHSNIPAPQNNNEIHKINKDKSHSLEYLLEHRSTPQQLQQQNIMHGGMFMDHINLNERPLYLIIQFFKSYINIQIKFFNSMIQHIQLLSNRSFHVLIYFPHFHTNYILPYNYYSRISCTKVCLFNYCQTEVFILLTSLPSLSLLSYIL